MSNFHSVRPQCRAGVLQPSRFCKPLNRSHSYVSKARNHIDIPTKCVISRLTSHVHDLTFTLRVGRDGLELLVRRLPPSDHSSRL